MMTIKEFARLCGCNAQTLRYYDRIDLLKPVKVDPWTGYRYYASPQAIDFVKIKNLQAADFTIDEIKVLLTRPDQQVYEAFERKIAEQTEKLARIREIQQSYLTEKTMMEKIVHSVTEYILSNSTNLDVLKEFGLTTEDAPEVLACLRAYFNRLIAMPDADWNSVTLKVNEEVVQGGEQVLERIGALTEENLSDTVLLGGTAIAQENDFDPDEWTSLWERHGWNHVHEFIEEIPAPEPGKQYCLRVLLTGDQYWGDLSFSMFLLGSVLLKHGTEGVLMGAATDRSPDGENHFYLLCK